MSFHSKTKMELIDLLVSKLAKIKTLGDDLPSNDFTVEYGKIIDDGESELKTKLIEFHNYLVDIEQSQNPIIKAISDHCQFYGSYCIKMPKFTIKDIITVLHEGQYKILIELENLNDEAGGYRLTYFSYEIANNHSNLAVREQKRCDSYELNLPITQDQAIDIIKSMIQDDYSWIESKFVKY